MVLKSKNYLGLARIADDGCVLDFYYSKFKNNSNYAVCSALNEVYDNSSMLINNEPKRNRRPAEQEVTKRLNLAPTRIRFNTVIV